MNFKFLKGRILKQITSFIMVFLMVFGMLPWQSIVQAATNPTVEFTYVFENPSAFKPKSKTLLITDSTLASIPIGKKTVTAKVVSDGLYKPITITDLGDRIQAEIDLNWDIDSILVQEKDGTKSIEYKNISKAKNAEVSSVTTPQVDAKGPIVLNGKSLGDFVNDTNNIVNVLVGGLDAKISKDGTNSDSAKIEPIGSAFGQQQILQNIILKIQKKDLDMSIDGNAAKYDLQINNVYKNAVEIVGVLALDGITMFPASGQPEDEISFVRKPMQDYDVYFVPNVSDKSKFDSAHKAIFSNFGQDESGNDVLKVKVPKLPEGPGNYKVVIANKNSLSEGIKSRYVLKEDFTYIEATTKSAITLFNPKEAAQQTSEQVSITANYIANLNLQGYAWDPATDSATYTIVNDSNGKASGRIDVDYGTKNFISGQYNGLAHVKREIRVYIGDQATFVDGKNTFDPKSPYETIVVNTPIVNNIPSNTVKIKIAIKTIIIYKPDTAEEKILTMNKDVYSSEDFTFIPNTDIPKVTSVIPGIIPVEKNPSGVNYSISSKISQTAPKTMEFNIIGEKFLVTRNSSNKSVYPKVKIGDIEIDPNDSSDTKIESFEVFNNAIKVDGTKNNEIGNRIKIVLKISEINDIAQIGKQAISIANPWRNQDANNGIYVPFPQMIEFKEIGVNDFPIITDVTPRIVAIGGNEKVIVKGNNFQTGLKLYIDGKEVTGVKVGGGNDTIEFTAPAGREGKTQIIVINPNGAIATYPFMYTKTYSDPKLINLNPNEGTTNTTVVVIGENFKDKDPTVDASKFEELDENLIYRLMGTRVFMDEKDINEYNIENGAIKLMPFTQSQYNDIKQPVIVTTNNEEEPLVVGKDFRSTILVDEINKKFYSLKEENKQIKIVDGLGTEFLLLAQKDSIDPTKYKIEAQKELNTYDVDVTNKGLIKLTLKTDSSKTIILTAYTPYKIGKYKELENAVEKEYDGVIGNRVFFINSSKLIFTVPFLGTSDKVCDVKIVNPDIKSVEKKQAFKYYASSYTNPVVDSFDPVSGPEKGGNIVIFKSPDDIDPKTKFVDNGDKKTRIFIGDQEVPANDVFISPDGKELTIKVPKYNRTITGDWVVEPVVLVNPDGGSFNITINNPIEFDNQRVTGYTYVRPYSNPKISSIIPSKGPSLGGNQVEIFGTDFRDWEPFSDTNGNGKKDLEEVATIDIVGGKDKYYDRFYDDGSNGKPKNGVYDIGEDIIGGSIETSKYNSQLKYIKSPLLPKVYFGTKEAEITGFKDGYIQVIAPPGEGAVDVYIINNDTGISDSKSYTYEKTNLSIAKVIPNIGNKKGGDRIEIIGDGFDDKAVVRFGDITNRELPRENANSGAIRAGNASVKLEEPLRIYTAQYAADSNTLTLTIKEGDKVYEYIENNYDGSVKYINTLQFKIKNGTDSYTKEELIKVEIDNSKDPQKTNRLFIEAGYAPKIEHDEDSPQKRIIVTTPNYNTVGKVALRVINPDGSEGKSEFEFRSPDSKPTVTELTRDGQPSIEETINDKKVKVIKVNYKGTSTVGVIGSDFRENIKISIGDILEIPYKDINPTFPDKLTFTVPAVDYEQVKGKLYKVVVTNEDGGTANSEDPKNQLPIYIMFVKGETEPKIEKLTPNSGPSTGGTKVKIEGLDFRNSLEGYDKKLGIYFGDVKIPDDKIQFVDYKTIYVTTTSHAPGIVDVKLENPDGEMTILKDAFTFLSNPKITNVVSPTDDSVSITEISVDGGESVKIKGADFMEGSRVVFVPVLEEVKGDNPTGDIITINGTNYILKSGTDAAEVKFIDTNTLTVKTPAGKLDTKGVIVINPDKSATSIYEGIKYVVSQLPAPKGVEAVLMYDKYIKISWNKVDDAKEYEIYAIEDNKEMQLIGSTQLTSFVYNDIKSNTDYTFIVKAIGQYGLSKGSEKSNKVSTGRNVGPTNPDGNLNENTSSVKTGDTATVTIGTKDYADKDIVIDLTRGNLAGSKEVVISIPASVVASYYSKNIIVVGSDFNLKLNPSAFNVAKVEQNKSKSDAGVKFRIAPYNEKVGNSLSNEYVMYANAFVGQDKTNIDYLKSKIELTLDYDVNKANIRKYNSVYLYRYDDYNSNWVFMKDRTDSYSSAITGTLERLGRYSIMGSRR